MKYNIISSLALRICFFLGLYILTVQAEVGIQLSYPSKLGQRYPLDTRAKDYNGIDLLGVNSIKSIAPKWRIFKRARYYTSGEEKLLLKLRKKGMTWKEISKSFPGRTRQSLREKYKRVLREQALEKTPWVWTSDEEEILLKLAETDKSWDEIAEYLPGRSAQAVGLHYKVLSDGSLAAKRARHRYMPEEDKLLLKLKEAGVPWKDMPAHFNNRTQASLESRYKALGQPFAERPQRYTTKEDRKIIKGVNSGMTAEQISRSLKGRSKPSVQTRIRRLRELGQLETIRSGRNYTDADLELIDGLVEDGMSWEDIATEYFPERSGSGIKLVYWRYKTEKKKQEKI